MPLIAIIEKELRMFFRYPLRVFSAVLVGIIFLIQFVFFGQAVLGGRYSQLLASSTGIGDYPTYALIGYVLWWLSVSPMEAYVWGIRRELQRGTFETNIAAPIRITELLLGLAVSWLIMDSVLMVIVFAFGVLIFDISLTFSILLKSLPILLLSFLAFLGFGFIFAGLVMMLKHIGPFAQIFEFAMLFFSGVFFPLNVMPRAIIEFSKILPLTHSITAIRGIFVGKTYAEIASSITWLLLLVLVYWLVGYILFRWAERITKVMGYGGY
ncbi:ABC transporter permease [Thermococcus paralvinellae]|uniref:ABC-type multidrug transport system, permease component n=1 Tax=Thermococcus paralvinellae TaxID=582419 RepID=W0I8Z8_9EURY|nr:ABC transporter permease [Thermococcus paralvinellae]AHF80920.1 ABC-type multidrug transport system, permease component [Thermococcus paralvinellae]